MLAIRPVVYVLLAGLLAGCSIYDVDYRLWHKANAPDDELKAALSACGPESRVGSVEGNPDPRTYFEGPATQEQTQANRLFQKCMVGRGWWALQPPL
jgi:hypothetical protein